MGDVTNKPKQKGTAAESAVVSFLRTAGFPWAERLALQGGKDRGDITGIPGVVVEVKSVQTYAFNQWLKEAQVERDNAQADFGFVVAKPRMVGTTRTGSWYSLMYAHEFMALVQAAVKHADLDEISVWTKEMSGHSMDQMVAANCTHSCVRIAPKGVKDPSMYYVVTTLAQMSELLVLAGYGRHDDQVGA
jgi:hypothetical protein